MILVTGLVSHRTHEPRIDIRDTNGQMHVQMDAEDAIKVALDMIKMSEATMADALLIKWAETNFPEKGTQFAGALMVMFRDFRADLENDSQERQKDGDQS